MPLPPACGSIPADRSWAGPGALLILIG